MNREEAEKILDRKLNIPAYDSSFFKNKIILITGAGGSIGSAFAEELATTNIKKLLLLEIDEIELSNIAERLKEYSNIMPIVGDVTDEKRLKELFIEYPIDIIIHTAAYKHLPIMEYNPTEAVKVNILGTYKLAKLSMKNSVKQFLFISTDKAVEPTSVMGISKKIAEQICNTLNTKGQTKFTILRFGNILGSRGSVTEIFKEKIKHGKTITITHPEMKRFFITIKEAVGAGLYLISNKAKGTFIFNVSRPIKITELATRMINLYAPGEKIGIKYSKPASGEKIEEKLHSSSEKTIKTNTPTIWQILNPEIDINFEEKLQRLQNELATETSVTEKAQKIKMLLKNML